MAPTAGFLSRVNVLLTSRILLCMIAPLALDRHARLLPFWQILKCASRILLLLSALCRARDSLDCEALPWMTRTLTPFLAARISSRPTRCEFSMRETER